MKLTEEMIAFVAMQVRGNKTRSIRRRADHARRAVRARVAEEGGCGAASKKLGQPVTESTCAITRR